MRFSSNAVAQVVEELDKILALNNLLISLKNHPDAVRFSPGVGPVSLLGMNTNNVLAYVAVMFVLTFQIMICCIL